MQVTIRVKCDFICFCSEMHLLLEYCLAWSKFMLFLCERALIFFINIYKILPSGSADAISLPAEYLVIVFVLLLAPGVTRGRVAILNAWLVE